MAIGNRIEARGLSKAYAIGTRRERADTLVGALKDLCRMPLRNYQHLRSLNRAAAARSRGGTLWALEDVSFDVQPGEVIGIVGRNGAGKSTLLKVLSRITEPTRGEAWIDGRVSSLLEVGTGFHPELTGRENIYLNGTILGMTKREIDRKFDQIVDFAGVERFLDTPIKRFSSGMQVRLAFSVAAHLDPDILIIDEVLAVGDAEFQKKCIGKMQEVAGGGRTVLFVSHNFSAVGQLCTSGLLLSGGQVRARGDLRTVLQTYMDDLFATSAEVGDEELNVTVRTAVNGEQNQRSWEIGDSLQAQVDVYSREAIDRPAVDLYLYSTAGRMVFAQSDKFIARPETDGHHHHFEFQLVNNCFSSDYVTLDVGFRFSSSTRYLRLWRSVAALALGPIPEGHTQGRDCPVCVPCQVNVREVAA